MEYIGYVYILECANGKYYTGSTNDIESRITQHREGLGSNFTKKYLPFNLVYVQVFETVELAFHREKQIQGWSHKKKEALIASDINSLQRLAECKNESHANSIYSHNIGKED